MSEREGGEGSVTHSIDRVAPFVVHLPCKIAGLPAVICTFVFLRL